jgi:hypothetical protein
MGAFGNVTAPFGLLRPVDVDPYRSAAEMGNLQALSQMRQMRQQEMQSQQTQQQLQGIQLQQAQQDFQDQQKWRQAYLESGGDLDKAFSLAAQRGVGPRTLTPIREQVTKHLQERANLSKTEAEARAAHNDLLNGLLTPVESETDPAKQKVLFDTAVTQGIQQGAITPEEAAQHLYPGPEGVKRWRAALTTDKWLTAKGAAQRGEAQTGELGLRREEWTAKQAEQAGKDLAVRLGASKDQNDYNRILQEAGQTLPYSIVKKFEDRTADEAQLLGMTSAEQAKAMKETPEKLPTEYSLAYQRTNPKDPPEKRAADAMKFVDQSRLATRPVQGVTVMVPNQEGGYTVTKAGVGQTVGPGAVTPAGMSSLNVPTANTRGMAEKAPRVIEFVDRINQLLDENEKQLGPLASRWNEFTAGKVGLKNKGYTQLRTDAGLLQTALMNMHVGARGGGQMMEHFKTLIDTSIQDPDNLRAALGEIRDYASRVQGEGGPKGVTAPTAPAAPSGAKIRVRRKSDGATGTINPGDWDFSKYDKL